MKTLILLALLFVTGTSYSQVTSYQSINELRKQIKVTTIATDDGRCNTINLGAKGIADIVEDDYDNLYVTSIQSNSIKKLTPDGNVTMIPLNNRQTSNTRGGDVRVEKLYWRDGFLYGISNLSVFKIAPNGDIWKMAGANNSFPFYDGAADSSTFHNGGHIAVASSGTIYVADWGNERLRIIKNGKVRSYEIRKTIDWKRDVKSESIHFNFINDLIVDAEENVYLSQDYLKSWILKAAPDGSVSLHVGNGLDISKDGNGSSAGVKSASGMVMDKNGIIYFTERSGKIRLITPNKNVITLVGNEKQYKYGKDGVGDVVSFNSPNEITIDKKGDLLVLDNSTAIRKVVLPKNLITTILKNDKVEKSPSSTIDSLKAVERQMQSLTKEWAYLQPTNSNNISEKQYKGFIGKDAAYFNFNINGLNLRQQREMKLYANIGRKVDNYYFSEYSLYGAKNLQENVSVLETNYQIVDSSYAKYLTGQVSGFLQNTGQYVFCRFVNDSSQVEGYLVNRTISDTPKYFKLDLCTPSLEMKFHDFHLHRDAQIKNGKLAIVPATISYSVNLPDPNENYNVFLNKQTGGAIGGWSEDTSHIHYHTYNQAVAQYKKEFDAVLQKTKVSHTRSLPGGFDNNEIVYNQKDWLVLVHQSFVGDIEGYGALATDYISYDVKRHKFLKEKDVLINRAAIQKLIDANLAEDFTYNLAFVCADGLGFYAKANHGWTYDFYFLTWNDVLPILNDSFKKEYTYLWTK